MMAVVGMPLDSTLVVVYQTGVTQAGGPILRRKSLNSVNTSSVLLITSFALSSVIFDESQEINEQNF